MPWSQGMYQISKGNTCTPLSVRCCSAYTVTTGTFDPPTHRNITTIHPVSVIVHTRQLFFVSFNTEMILQIGSWLAFMLLHPRQFCSHAYISFRQSPHKFEQSAVTSYLLLQDSFTMHNYMTWLTVRLHIAHVKFLFYPTAAFDVSSLFSLHWLRTRAHWLHMCTLATHL